MIVRLGLPRIFLDNRKGSPLRTASHYSSSETPKV